jgi:hypothetical protein
MTRDTVRPETPASRPTSCTVAFPPRLAFVEKSEPITTHAQRRKGRPQARIVSIRSKLKQMSAPTQCAHVIVDMPNVIDNIDAKSAHFVVGR